MLNTLVRVMRRAFPLLCAAVVAPLSAQSVVISGGPTVRAQVSPGQKITVPVTIDLTNGGGTNVASLTLGVTWNAARLTLDSVRSAGFGSLTANTANAGTGSASLSTFDGSGTNVTATMARLYFTAAGTTGGTRVAFSPTVAGSDQGASILGIVRRQALDVCVAASAKWGDVNADNSVNVIDAQQIARASVSLSVVNPAAVAAQGDVTNDGAVNIIDAQQIARFSVGLTAAARVNAASFAVPAVAGVVLDQNTLTVAPGGSAEIVATPQDATTLPLSGCVPVLWSSNDSTVARVDSTGRISALATGSAIITASAGGQSANATVTVATSGSPPASIAIVAGDDQWTAQGQPVSVQPSVIVRDASNNPVTGASVRFTATAGTFNGGSPQVVLTDSTGTATVLTGWNSAPGPQNTMTADVVGTGLTTTFHVNVIGSTTATATCMYDFWSTRCWGLGTRGQLGNGTNVSSTVPVTVNQVGLDTLKGVTRSTFGDHFCSLTRTVGEVLCWGFNEGGQLGDGTRTNRNTPTPVAGGLSFTTVATGQYHTCGVTSAGEVYCWGLNVFGQIGDSTRGGSYPTPVKAHTPAGVLFKDVSTGNNHTCAVSTTNAVYCWGLNSSGQVGDGTITSAATPRTYPTLVIGGHQFDRVSGGTHTTCALTPTGDAYCWGNNTVGQLGSATASTGVPTLVDGGHVFSEIAVTNGRACGVKTTSDHTVWCWGGNNGLIGDGSVVGHPAPVPLPISVYSLFMSVNTTCGLGFGGQQVFCWGSNNVGQVGDATTTSRNSPTLVTRAGAAAGVAIAMNPNGVNMTPQSAPAGTAVAVVPEVLVRDGEGNPVSGVTVNWVVLAGGGTTVNSSSVTDASGFANAGGWTLGATIGVQTIQARIPGVLVNGSPAGQLRATFVAYGTATPASLVRITPGDSVYVGGVNPAVAVPFTVRALDAASNPIGNVAVTFSGPLTTTLLTDAQGYATVPGNTFAGVASTLTASVPGGVTPVVTRIVVPTVLTGSGLVSCELASSGAAYCAGSNAEGAVGDGTTINRSTFVPVSGGHVFTTLAEGTSQQRCALEGTAAYCWGQNTFGQVGDGTRTNRTVPTLVSGGLSFNQLVTQNLTTCGLTTASEVYCWGWTGSAGWGNGESDKARIHTTPTLVNTNGHAFVQIALSDDGICGRTSAGVIHCLARGSSGFNGDGTFDQLSAFSTWSGGPWAAVVGGNLNFCALDLNGAAYCVGGAGNTAGSSFGNPQFTSAQAAPVPVAGNINFASLYLGNMRACGRTSAGELYCWGLWAGSGSANAVMTPTRVPGPAYVSMRQTTFRNACAKTINGMLYCWGSNSGASSGTVGDGVTTGERTTPTAVLGWPDGPAAGIPVTVMTNSTRLIGAPISTAVSPVPSVIVRDRLGTPIAGVTVNFTAASGHGVIAGASQVTDGSGVATVGSWTMPSTVGTYFLTAQVTGLPPAMFEASTTPPPASITVVGASTQYLPDALLTTAGAFNILVKDASNNPMPGVVVTWTVTPGSGSATASTTTNAQGIASLTNWSVPTTLGSTYTVQAGVIGLSPVTLTAKRLQWNGHSSSVCRLNAAGAAYCWGTNTDGEVGDGTTTQRTLPTAVIGGHTFASLAKTTHGFHQCGLKSNGEAWCWGTNDAGQLGNGTQVNATSPVQVSGGLVFASLALGPLQTCGLTTTSEMYCWGWGSYSQRADGELYSIRTTPTLVNTNGLTFTSIAVGTRSICGLTASGQAYCWGENFGGQVGNSSTIPQTQPTATSTTLRFTKLVEAMDHVCGLTLSSSVACWGYNANGAIGNGTTINQLAPQVVAGISGALDLASGEAHSCARTSSTVYCWGNNNSGQVGDRSNIGPRPTPLTVGAGMSVTGFSTFARSSSCATTSTQMYCWGFPTGNQTTGAPGNRPVAVAWPDASASNPAQLSSPSVVGVAGSPVSVTTKVQNHLGAGLSGITVNFTITSGGGTLSAASAVSDVNGNATVTWTPAGSDQAATVIEAQVSGLPIAYIVGTIAPLLAKGVATAVPTIAAGTPYVFSYQVPAGATGLTITTSGGTGDADVYIYSPGATLNPPNAAATPAYNNASNSSTTAGTNTETINRTTSVFQGSWHVIVFARNGAAVSGLTITATHTP